MSTTLPAKNFRTYSPKTIQELIDAKFQIGKPKIVCLCGSTSFFYEFKVLSEKETLQGRIVLAPNCDTKSVENSGITESQKLGLDLLHLAKIDLCDYIIVINKGGYIGESTKREIEYAKTLGKKIFYLEGFRGQV